MIPIGILAIRITDVGETRSAVKAYVAFLDSSIGYAFRYNFIFGSM